jgi:glycosyltransferase involved in cell wall biosynthesis
LFHDYFSIRGGGERLVLTLANELNAELIYGYRTEESYSTADFPTQSTSLGLPNLLKRTGLRPLSLAIKFICQRRFAQKFSVRIFSGVAAPFAAPKQKNGVNIFYCHTPPRFLFDQRQHFLRRMPLSLRLFSRPLLNAFEFGYRRAVNRMDAIVTNSENTRIRIKHYLGVESVVIYPPIEIDQFSWKGQSDYYLSTARLTALKRVDLIVSAFLKMPEKRLVVISGGEELGSLKRQCAGANNISFLGWVSDEALVELVGNAIATIYLPHDEDFGMSVVESMAAGKPVIGVAEGGLKETIVPGATGVLLSPDFAIEDVVTAVRSMTSGRAAAMRRACERAAQKFSRQSFVEKVKQLVSSMENARSN